MNIKTNMKGKIENKKMKKKKKLNLPKTGSNPAGNNNT